MTGLNEQTAAAPIAQLLRATETEFCRLRAEHEAIEISLDEVGRKDSFRIAGLRAELRSVSEKMACVQIEQLEHRIALLKAGLPGDRDAVAPAQCALDEAQQRYLQAGHDRDTAAVALHNAQAKVSSAESNLSFYERTIQELKQKLASKGNPERSASEIAKELNTLEKRIGRLKTISTGLSVGN